MTRNSWNSTIETTDDLNNQIENIEVQTLPILTNKNELNGNEEITNENNDQTEDYDADNDDVEVPNETKGIQENVTPRQASTP